MLNTLKSDLKNYKANKSKNIAQKIKRYNWDLKEQNLVDDLVIAVDDYQFERARELLNSLEESIKGVSSNGRG